MAGKSRIAESYVQVEPVLAGMSDAIAEQLEEGFKESNKQTKDQSEDIGKESGVALAAAAASAIGAGAIAAALGAQFKQGYENAIEQMDANSSITANLNLDAEQSKMVSESVKDLYTSGLGESYEEVAQSMESVVGTIQGAREASADELSKMGRDIGNLSKQYDVESGEVARAVNGMMGTGFAESSDEAFQTIHNGFQVMGEYGTEWIDTLRESTGEFTTFGLEGDAAIQLMKEGMDAGIMQTDLWADAFNEMSIRLQDGTADEYLMNIGLDPAQIKAQIAEGGDAAQEAFTDIMIGLQNNGGMEDFAGILGSIGEDYNAEINKMDFSVIQQGLGDTVQSLDEFDAAVNSGISHELTEIQRNFEQAFTDAIIPILEAILPLITSFTEFLKENTWVLKILVPILGVALVAALLLMTAALWSAVPAAWALIVPLLPIVGTILLIVAAVAAVIAIGWLLVKHWDSIWGFVKNIAGSVGEFFVNLWNGIGDFFIGLWNGIIGFFADTWGNFMDFLAEGWSQIAGFFIGMWDGPIGWFVDAWNSVGDFFVGLWNGLLDFFIGIYDAIIDIINEIIDLVPGGRFVVEGVGGFLGNFGINVPFMAEGGTIPARPGGTLAVLGESGRDEVVMDKGKWNKALDMINANGVSKAAPVINQNITVNQQPGESTDELLERLNWHMDFTGTR